MLSLTSPIIAHAPYYRSVASRFPLAPYRCLALLSVSLVILHDADAGTCTNLALRRFAYMISELKNNPACTAVDGLVGEGHWFHTASNAANQWWAVDLGNTWRTVMKSPGPTGCTGRLYRSYTSNGKWFKCRHCSTCRFTSPRISLVKGQECLLFKERTCARELKNPCSVYYKCTQCKGARCRKWDSNVAVSGVRCERRQRCEYRYRCKTCEYPLTPPVPVKEPVYPSVRNVRIFNRASSPACESD